MSYLPAMPRLKNKESSNIVYLKIFLIFVFVCVVVSLFLKLTNLVNKSQFNQNYYNMVLIGKKAFIINIRQSSNKINIIEIKNSDIIKLEKLTKFQMGADFGIPIDAVFIDRIKKIDNPIDVFNLVNSIEYILMPSYYNSSELNSLDILKIHFVFSSLSTSDYTKDIYDMSDNNSTGNDTKSRLYDYFKDENIVNEGISIEVINGSQVDGAASKIAWMLKNNGFNVVSIISSDKEYNLSNIVCRTSSSYSTRRIEKIFSVPLSCKNETGIADIGIVLGKDYKLNYCSNLSLCDN